MSIIAYVGLPGSGKSYGVVENVILPALEQGRTIITNIPVRSGYLQDDYPKGRVISFDTRDPLNHDSDTWWNIENHPKGAIWVIDEAWRYWKSGTRANQIPEKEMQFFTEHRHVVGEDGFTTEIVLVTQDLQQVASCIRDLVEETYRAVKLTALGQKNRYRVDVHQGSVKLAQKGQPLRQLFGKYSPDVYKYYLTHTHNKTDFAAGMEEKADDRANILKSPLIKYGLPLALIVMAYSAYNVYSYLFGRTADSEQRQIEQPSTDQPAQQSQGLQKTVRKPIEEHTQGRLEIEPDWLPVSDSWRIVGEVNGVYWIWGEGGTRKIHSRVCGKTRRTGEPYCVIQGKLVTYYSYREPERENSTERDYVSGVSETFN